MLSFRCSGINETCPPEELTELEIRKGQAILTTLNFDGNATFQSQTDQLYLEVRGFTVSCGDLILKWSLLNTTDTCMVGPNGVILPSDTDNYILNSLNLENFETYKIAVQATDSRGISSTSPVCTGSVTIDSSRPTGGWVQDGLGRNDLQYQSNKTIGAKWGGFYTAYGIAKYEVAVRYQPIEADTEVEVKNFSSVGEENSFTATYSSISDGSNVTTEVRAFTKAGLYTEISSDGVIVDTSKPLPGSVFDGPSVSSDLQYSNWATTYDLSWKPFSDPHTPIIEYKVGVRESSISNTVTSAGLKSVGLETSVRLSGLSLSSGEKYCGIVQGVNAAGLATVSLSDCLVIDQHAPLPGVVNDGTDSDIDYQSQNTLLNGSWIGFRDNVNGSGIAEYVYKITDQNGEIVTNWTSAGLDNKVLVTGLNLVDGNSYQLTVRAIDQAGNYVDVKSDGVYVDTTPPTYTDVTVKGRPGKRGDQAVVYISSNGRIDASWLEMKDVHSGMKKYMWCVVQGDEQPEKWNDLPDGPLRTSAVFR